LPRRRPRAPVLATLLGAFVAIAAGQDATSAPTPINTHCPVMTEEEVNPAITTTYQGQVIGFCCENCRAKFEANPTRYAARLAAFQEPATKPIDTDRHGQDMQSIAADDHDHEHEHEHEHEEEHEVGEGFASRLIGWLGKFHPPTVNFPIAMLVGAALAELLLIKTRRTFFANANRFCLWVGCLGAVAGATLGWFFAGFHLVDDTWILTVHRWLGTTTGAWSILLLVFGERTFRRADAGRRTYRILLFVGAGLVAITGFLGGSLIYGLKHYAW
jgi:uncharacterized membrane protein/YHS domain-containing protein